MWADSGYRSQEIEEKLSRRGLKSRIHRRAYRNRELSETQKAANKTRSKVRARVEHVFGDQKNSMGAEIVRYRSREMQDRIRAALLQAAAPEGVVVGRGE